jgi:hypothetical protein
MNTAYRIYFVFKFGGSGSLSVRESSIDKALEKAFEIICVLPDACVTKIEIGQY